MNISLRYTLFFFILTMLISCRKECHYKHLPGKDCGDNYHEYSSTYRSDKFATFIPYNTIYIINSDSAYKEVFAYGNDTMPFGPVDFSNQSIICAKVRTGSGNDLKHQGYLCKKNDAEEWKFTIEYTLRDQCKGSGVYSHTFTASVFCDKIPDNAIVNLNFVNINPM